MYSPPTFRYPQPLFPSQLMFGLLSCRRPERQPLLVQRLPPPGHSQLESFLESTDDLGLRPVRVVVPADHRVPRAVVLVLEELVRLHDPPAGTLDQVTPRPVPRVPADRHRERADRAVAAVVVRQLVLHPALLQEPERLADDVRRLHRAAEGVLARPELPAPTDRTATEPTPRHDRTSGRMSSHACGRKPPFVSHPSSARTSSARRYVSSVLSRSSRAMASLTRSRSSLSV